MKYDFDNDNLEIDYSNIDWQDYNQQLSAWYDKQMEKSDALPDGLQVGKILRVGVADGYAYYEIEKIFKKTVRIKWKKNMCPDQYQDRVLFWGGSFPKNIIESIVYMCDSHRKVFKNHAY